ncbi:MAG: polysaccharide deacetylase family protein [Candidatus Thorarchaeota archaeon]
MESIKDSILKPAKDLGKRLLMRTSHNGNIIEKNQGLLVLCYHSIPIEGSWYYDINADKFEQHLKYLSKKFDIVSPSDLNNSRIFDERIKAMITFDDGYLDNYINVYPLLDIYETPATFFITANPIDDTNQQIVEPVKGLEKKLLNWDQLREMAKHEFVTIGSHGLNHIAMSEISREEAKTEMLRSKELIEEKTKNRVNDFAYPGGFFNDITGTLLSEIGYKQGFTSVSCVNKIPFNHFQIGRVAVAKQHESLHNLSYLLRSVLRRHLE